MYEYFVVLIYYIQELRKNLWKLQRTDKGSMFMYIKISIGELKWGIKEQDRNKIKSPKSIFSSD